MNATDRPTHPSTEPDSIDRPEPQRATRNIPPLVWVVAAIFVAWLAIALLQRDDSHVTPQGGVMPQAEEREAVMPAAPSTATAPATPAAEVRKDDPPE